MNNLKSWYTNIFKIDSIYKANLINSLQIPKISKTTINISSKSIIENPKSILYYVISLKLNSNLKLNLNFYIYLPSLTSAM